MTRLRDREREELLNRFWRSYEFDLLEAKNTTIVFSAGPFDTNPRQYGWQGQRMPVTATIAHLARHPSVATLRTLIWIEELRFSGLGLLRMRLGVQSCGAARRQLARGNGGELPAAAR